MAFFANRRTRLIRLILFEALFTILGLVGLIRGSEHWNGGGWFLLVGGAAVSAVSLWQLKSTKISW